MEQLHGRISLLSSAVCVISVGHLKGCWQLDVYSRLPSSPESRKCLYNHESTSNIRPLLPEFMLCFILKLKWPLRMRDIIIFTVQSSCEGSNGNLFQSFISNQNEILSHSVALNNSACERCSDARASDRIWHSELVFAVTDQHILSCLCATLFFSVG